MWFHSKRPYFALYYLVFFPTVVQILVGSVDSCFLTNINTYMTPIHALILKTCQNVCLQDMLKSRCTFVMLLGKYAQQKQVGWEVIFSELGFAESGARKPWWELEGSVFDLFFHVVLQLRGLNGVGKVPHKSQCKKYIIWEAKIKAHLGKVCNFLPTLFSKNHRNIML